MFQLSVYPNPFRDKVIIQGATKTTPWSVYNTFGKKIRSGIGTEINLAKLSKGMYHLVAAEQSFKIIKY